MKKKNLLIKWMLGISIVLMAVGYLTLQSSNNIFMPASSHISPQNNFFQFLANLIGIGRQGSSSNGPSNGNNTPGRNNPNLGQAKNAGQQNPDSKTSVNTSTSQGANAGNNAGANAGNNAGNSGNNSDATSGANAGNTSGNNSGGNSGSDTGNLSGGNSGGNSGGDSGGNSGGDSGGNSGGVSGNNPNNNNPDNNNPDNNNPNNNNPDNNNPNNNNPNNNNPNNNNPNNNNPNNNNPNNNNPNNNNPNNNNPHNSCVQGCYPGCIPECDSQCLPPNCLLGGVNASGLPTINPVPSDPTVTQNITNQNQQAAALAAELASREALVLPVVQQAQASKYQEISYQSIPVPSTNPTPSDIEAKVQSKQYSFH